MTRNRAIELINNGATITYSVTFDKFLIRDPKMARVQTIRKATANKLIKGLREVEFNKFQKDNRSGKGNM